MRSLVARRILPFWPVSPSPQIKDSEWRDTHKGATEEALNELCRTPLPLIGGITHPHPHDSNALKDLIKSKMRMMKLQFPMTWQQTQNVVYRAGPCRGCDAGVLIDGQLVQGKYDGRRLPIHPDFQGNRPDKILLYCKFCRTDDHPIKIARKERLIADRELEESLMGSCVKKVVEASPTTV